jgi:hypothetical protein
VKSHGEIGRVNATLAVTTYLDNFVNCRHFIPLLVILVASAKIMSVISELAHFSWSTFFAKTFLRYGLNWVKDRRQKMDAQKPCHSFSIL